MLQYHEVNWFKCENRREAIISSEGLNLWNNLKGVNWQPLKTMYGRMM